MKFHPSKTSGFSAPAAALGFALLFLALSVGLAAGYALKPERTAGNLGTLIALDGTAPFSQAPGRALPTPEDYQVLDEGGNGSDFIRRRDEYATGTPATSSPITAGELFALAPSAVLSGQSGAIGKAGMAVFEGATYVRLAAIGLPALPEGVSYYGWLVRDLADGEVTALGALGYDPAKAEAQLAYVHPGDLASYRTVMVSAGGPGSGLSAGAVLEGAFPDDALFFVTRDDLARAREAAGQPPLPPAGTETLPDAAGSRPATTTDMTGGDGAIKGRAGGLGDDLLFKLLAGQSAAGPAAQGTRPVSLEEELAKLLGGQAAGGDSLSDQELLKRLLGQ